MMDELKAFADWLNDNFRIHTLKADDAGILKKYTTDQLVEEFRREQRIREEHQADETDAR